MILNSGGAITTEETPVARLIVILQSIDCQQLDEVLLTLIVETQKESGEII